MDVQIRHTPSFAVARCMLTGGETMRAESGAMMATSDGVAIEASMQGGLVKSLKRSVLGGESLFITTYTAPASRAYLYYGDEAKVWALLLAIRDVARTEGVAEALLEEWRQSLPELEARAEAAERSAGAKGWRWIAEMEEIASTFASADLPDGFHRAAAEVFRRAEAS